MITSLFNLIVILIEVAVVLVVLNVIFYILRDMFSIKISWKKFLLSGAAIFGILWLRDHWRNSNDEDDSNILEIETVKEEETNIEE